MSVEAIRAEREQREARARERAKTIEPGDYHVSDYFVVNSTTREVVFECETHWDACLVMLAVPRA